MKKVTIFLFIFIASGLYLKAQDSLQQYVAKFKFPQGSVVTEINVALDNGILTLTSSMGNAAIEKAGTDQFTIPAYNGTATFTRNEAKKVSGLKIEVMGILLEGTKEEKESVGGNSIPPLPIYKSTFPMKYLPSMLIPEDEGSPSEVPDLF
jgi:hypothetical protein